MAFEPKNKRDAEDDGENISRTGRQRKKSAKVLEMEAEAEELAQVLRARFEGPSTPKPRPFLNKGPRIKKTPTRVELESVKEDDSDGPPVLESESMGDSSPPSVGPDAMSKSGRVRKKSAKLLEMVEAEALDRKTFRTSHIPKSMRTAMNPSIPTPAKKPKLQPVVTSPAHSPESVSGSPPGVSPIKQLLSSPTKKSPGPTSPRPEPILSMLGAALTSPSKVVPQASPPVMVMQENLQLNTLANAAAALAQPPAQILSSPEREPKKEFEVKFLTDVPTVVTPAKPAKKRSKKQAMPTPSAPAAEKLIGISPVSPKQAVNKIKNIISPPKKPVIATNMADQPLLSKMMGEVGHIGPPPPSSAEAKSMKKKAKKEAAAALKNQTEGVLKKIMKDHPKPAPKVLVMPKMGSIGTVPHLPIGMGLSAPVPYIDDSNDEDDEEDQLMIDTTLNQKKKKVVKKEKMQKPKAVKVEEAFPKPEIVIPPQVETEEEIGFMTEEVVTQEAEEDMDHDEDDEDDIDDVDVEMPSYANTHVMANKVQTSAEKKASKEKKKKKGKKDDPEKQKKKRGPTAYMLWCNAHRAKLVKDTPGIDFATISKRLGEMWSSQTEKEKMNWKRKAKKLASKGSTVISTGKGVSQMVHGGSGATLLNKPDQPKAVKNVNTTTPAPSRPAAANQQRADIDQGLSPQKSNGCAPLDVAAHLKLLGESLSIIGARLQEHHGQIAVQGTLPVLLDSLLCALGPLSCLTTTIPQLDGAPIKTHANTLDNIAYIMPGIG